MIEMSSAQNRKFGGYGIMDLIELLRIAKIVDLSLPATTIQKLRDLNLIKIEIVFTSVQLVGLFVNAASLR